MYVNIGTQLQEVEQKPSSGVSPRTNLLRLRRVLVAPAGMGEARAVLAATGTVILQGEPGSGRTAAAKVLLREHHSDTGVLQELLPGEEDELSLHNPALVGDRDQLLLDLSGADDRQWSMARVDLPALRRDRPGTARPPRHRHAATVPYSTRTSITAGSSSTRPPGLERPQTPSAHAGYAARGVRSSPMPLSPAFLIRESADAGDRRFRRSGSAEPRRGRSAGTKTSHNGARRPRRPETIGRRKSPPSSASWTKLLRGRC